VPLAGLRSQGQVGLELGLRLGDGPDRDAARAVAALCAAHPGPAPVFVAWSDGNGSSARLRARRLRVDLTEELLDALRKLLGSERVRLTRAR
jgi:hypothetical protein